MYIIFWKELWKNFGREKFRTVKFSDTLFFVINVLPFSPGCKSSLFEIFHHHITLKEETFAGRNFRGFAVFSQIRESLFQRNFSKDVIRESFFPRNFLKKSSSAKILKKIRFCSYNIEFIGAFVKFQKIKNSRKKE